MSTPAGNPSGGGGRGGIFQRLDRAERAPYPRSHYVRRLLWVAVELLLFRPSPRRLSGWRNFLLRAMGARISPTASVRPSVRIRHPWLFSLGDYSSLGDDVDIYNLGPISIGSHSAVSQNAHLCAGTHDYTQPHLPLVRPPINIGSGVWICADAFIGPGVTVGDNALIGARAVVTKDVPPGVIVGGNPAKVLRERPMNLGPTTE